MSYIDARLPKRLAAGLQIGPTWRTEIAEMVNGGEKRNRRWLYPRWRASGNMGAFDATDREGFRALFVVAAGRARAFRVQDPLDWQAEDQPISPTVGSTTAVQLTKRYTFPGGSDYIDVRIQAPVSGTVTVYKDGSPVAGTLDTDTGLFTPSSTWASGTYTWDGEFDRWMRFDSDENAIVANALHVYTADIELIEVRRG